VLVDRYTSFRADLDLLNGSWTVLSPKAPSSKMLLLFFRLLLPSTQLRGLLCACWTLQLVSSLSTPPSGSSSTAPITRRPFVEISSVIGSGDRLPASIVTQWPTWVLSVTDNDDDEPPPHEWSKIPDESDGFVNPKSLEELWLPLDLVYPVGRLALGLHVRNGVCRHVFPALDLTLDDGSNKENHSPQPQQQERHRNRGLCSLPVAYQWQEFSAFVMAAGAMGLDDNNNNRDEDSCRLVLQTRPPDPGKPWETLLQMDRVEDLVARAMEALAQEPPSALGEGSHLVHVVSAGGAGTTVQCPKPGQELRVRLLTHQQEIDDDDDDDDDESSTATTELRVQIESTAAGSASDYLLDCYRPLFEDPALRRPAYREAQQRLYKKNDSTQ